MSKHKLPSIVLIMPKNFLFFFSFNNFSYDCLESTFLRVYELIINLEKCKINGPQITGIACIESTYSM